MVVLIKLYSVRSNLGFTSLSIPLGYKLYSGIKYSQILARMKISGIEISMTTTELQNFT